MSLTGHCNCEGVRVVLAETPANSVICHCTNCKRAGGGPYSTNYIIKEDAITIEDPNGSLKTYKDGNTRGGNVIDRRFCSNCGSPVVTTSPAIPGMAIVKAALFGSIAPPVKAVFEDTKEEWVHLPGL